MFLMKKSTNHISHEFARLGVTWSHPLLQYARSCVSSLSTVMLWYSNGLLHLSWLMHYRTSWSQYLVDMMVNVGSKKTPQRHFLSCICTQICLFYISLSYDISCFSRAILSMYVIASRCNVCTFQRYHTLIYVRRSYRYT